MDHKFISSTKFFSEVTKTVYLYGKVWREATTALIHGPRAVDKSAGALDIALDIARGGREVLYVNAGERLGRLAGSDAGHENLYMFTPEFESIDDTSDYADLVFEAIEQAVRATSIRTFVIDSVSRIAALSFGRNASVAYLMKRLVALQVKGRLSVLVVADDATKSVNNPLAALAASEIAVNEPERSDISDKSGFSEKSERSEKSEKSEKSEPADLSELSKLFEKSEPAGQPARKAMSIRQLRDMERRQAKLMRKNMTQESMPV